MTAHVAQDEHAPATLVGEAVIAVNAGVENVFVTGQSLGAQAGVMAWGEGPYAGSQEYDFGRKFGISISMLWGFKKPKFGPDNFQSPSTYTDDYGVIACDGYAAVIAGKASDTEY